MLAYHIEQGVNNIVLRKMSGTARALYAYLTNAQHLAKRHKRAWLTPRNQTIADDLGVCKRTIQRALARLRQAGAVVSQVRFVKAPNGLMQQVSNRLRVIASTAAAAIAKGAIEARRSQLRKYRGDTSVAPRTEKVMEAASRDYSKSSVYLTLMQAGLAKSRE